MNAPRANKRRLGLVIGSALALAPLVYPAYAQTTDANTKTEPAAVTQEAYFTAEADGVVPGTLVNEFPPGVSCILVPQACSNMTQPVTGPVGEAVPETETADYLSPQPVEENTLPVGMLGGKPRYTSYVKLQLPNIPQGSLVDRFDLILSEGAVSYALESPAFRQAVLAGFVTYQTRSPAEFTKFVGDVADETTPLADTSITGIELCAVTQPWVAGTSQDATAQPPRDCIFGANGVRDQATGTWTFDMALLVQAWLDGTTPNEGIYLGPIGADNLAFGDSDTSTNWQVSLNGKDATEGDPPKVRYAFSEGFADDFGAGGEEFTLDDAVIDDGSLSGSVVPSADPFQASTDTSGAGAGRGAVGAPAAGAGDGERPLRTLLAAESRPRTPWWLWVLLPFGAGLAYLFARSFEEDPPASRAGRGALTRLMASES